MLCSIMRRGAVVLVLPLVLAAVISCGGGDATDNGNVATSPATPTTNVTIVATDNKYDLKKITVPAGQQVTLVYQNKGSAIHDFRVLGIKSDDGAEITTPLDTKDHTITFTISKPGTYDYKCDVHPDMNGKLTVQ